MKSILVPAEAARYRGSVLKAAVLLGRIFGSYIEGCPLGWPYAQGYVPDPMGAPMIPHGANDDAATPEELHKAFTEFMLQNGAPPALTPEERLCFGWAAGELFTDYELGNYSRVFDIVVVGRPGSNGSGPRVDTLEQTLFEGGRPVLVVPPDIDENLGSSIVIAWNCSTESARTVSAAMGLLEVAKRVEVLTVEGGTVPGPSGAQLCKNLHAHGIHAEETTVPLGKSIGHTILLHANEVDADLIVKGAFTHSRLRQMIFGGATSHLIYNTDLPLLMAT